MLLTLLSLILVQPVEAKIVTKVVEYSSNGETMQGYTAYDDQKKGKLPLVIVIHEWTGLGDYVKSRSEMLAKLGYFAFAADVYGKGVRPQPPGAGEVAGKYKKNVPLFRERLMAALEEAKKNPKANANKAAAIGYCFGGTGALEMARAGADLKGVVSFHGGLSTPSTADAKNIKGKVLVLHGADDPYVPEAEVKAFEEEMRAAKVDWQLIKYAGAVHAFTNPAAGSDPSKGAAYQETADKRSWEHMKGFFAEILK